MEDISNKDSPIQKKISSRMDICRRCGRKLSDPKSIEVGFGKVCYKKLIAGSSLKPLFKIIEEENM